MAVSINTFIIAVMPSMRYLISTSRDQYSDTGFQLLQDIASRLTLTVATNNQRLWLMKLGVERDSDLPEGWHHFAFTWHMDTGLQYYQNGHLHKQISDSDKSHTLLVQQTNLTIGGAETAHYVPDMKVYGLTIWNKKILKEEVQENMISGEQL